MVLVVERIMIIPSHSGDRNRAGGDRALNDSTLSLCTCASPGQTPHGPIYHRTLTIHHVKVPSTQTDFPVLVSLTDPAFKTIGNGGHVQSSNGFDLRLYTDSGLTTPLVYQLERYNASTGELLMWVKVPSLSSVTDTVLYLGYGDASLNTDGSSSSTWSNGFLGVYHFGDGTTLNVNSATGSNNGTNHGATAATGQIDGSASFLSASTQYVEITNTLVHGAITYSAWVNATSLPNTYNTVISKEGSGAVSDLYVKSNGKLFLSVTANDAVAYDGTGLYTLSISSWNYLVMTYDLTNGLRGYVNANLDHNVAANGGLAPGAATTQIGGNTRAPGRYWNGAIDEARIASVARSADWITTEYNNQSDPGSFETLGVEI